MAALPIPGPASDSGLRGAWHPPANPSPQARGLLEFMQAPRYEEVLFSRLGMGPSVCVLNKAAGGSDADLWK